MQHLYPLWYFFLGAFITYNFLKALAIFRKPKTYEIREI